MQKWTRLLATAKLARNVGLAGLFSAASALLATTVPGHAQNGAPGAEAAKTGPQLWSEAGCFGCHGDLAAGGGDAANPAGPSLRTSRLDRAGLIEVISCGRPGTAMPMHLIGAYTEVACHGQPVGPVPADVTGTGVFTADEVATLVDFLDEHAVGVRQITRENCIAFLGDPNSRVCLQY